MPMKPTFEMKMKVAIAKQSSDRVIWNDAKKKAEAKKVNTKILGKKDLGPEFDALRDLVEAAKTFIKKNGPLDAKGKKVITDQADKVRGIIAEYRKTCATEGAKATEPAKAAWKTLDIALETRKAGVDNLARPVLK